MRHIAIGDVAAGFRDLKPLHPAQCLGRLANGVLNRILEWDNQVVLGQPPLTPTLTAKTVSVHKRALTDCISGRLVQTMRVLGVTVPNDPLPR